MKNRSGTSTPLSTTHKLLKSKVVTFPNPTLYRSIVGALQYAILIRPEIFFAVNKLSQFMSQPLEPHWLSYKRILRCINETLYFRLEFKKLDRTDLEACTDAN